MWWWLLVFTPCAALVLSFGVVSRPALLSGNRCGAQGAVFGRCAQKIKSKKLGLHERVRGCDRTRSRVNFLVLAVLPYQYRPTQSQGAALAF